MGRFSALIASRTSRASGRLSSASRRFSRCGMTSPVGLGDGEAEGCSFPESGLDPDCSSIACNHPLANSESNAGAAIFLVTMEPFEYAKDFLLVLRIDAYAVIAHGKLPGGIRLGRRDVDSGRVVLSIFESVADEILKHLLEVRFAHGYLRQLVMGHRRATFADGFCQAGKRVLQNSR